MTTTTTSRSERRQRACIRPPARRSEAELQAEFYSAINLTGTLRCRLQVPIDCRPYRRSGKLVADAGLLNEHGDIVAIVEVKREGRRHNPATKQTRGYEWMASSTGIP